jgi:hypothetical protein
MVRLSGRLSSLKVTHATSRPLRRLNSGQTAQDHNLWAKPIRRPPALPLRRSPSPSNYGPKSLIHLVINFTNLRYPQIYPRYVSKQRRETLAVN